MTVLPASFTTAIHWLRRDLRLRDNPALHYACRHAERVILVYIEAADEQAQWADGSATRWWLHHSLERLAADVTATGRQLVIRRAPSAPDGLRKLIADTGASLVTWNRLYEPAASARDARIETALQARDIEVHTFNGALLFEPPDIQKGSGGPFKVFTPFWRKCSQQLHEVGAPLPAPRLAADLAKSPRARTAPRGVNPTLASVSLGSLSLLPRIHWDSGLQEMWKPGEAGALTQLRRFKREVAHYVDERNRPDLVGTSRLSPHLHFGEISPRQVLAALHSDARPRSRAASALKSKSGTGAGPAGLRSTSAPVSRRASGLHTAAQAASYIRQLGWREFAHHLLFHFPHTVGQPLDPKFAHYPWVRSRKTLTAWQRGLTGYPLVDAGMRELWHTGWMHNRVRMIVASFLTKNLRHHWLEGAHWFWDTLVDADLPNNTLGWQWVAGCGADAAPYFRVFNPTLQAKRFDPERGYLRRWLPELAKLPNRWIHCPFDAPAEVLQQAGVKLGKDYPRPVVDLSASRDAALRGYVQIRRAAKPAN